MCSKPALPFAFDFADALVQNLDLSKSDAESSIDWPYAIISDFAWVSSQAKAVSVLSALNIIIMGVGTLVDGLLCSPGRNNHLFPSLSRGLTLVRNLNESAINKRQEFESRSTDIHYLTRQVSCSRLLLPR